MQNNDWHIGKVGCICTNCQKTFEVGETLFSSIEEAQGSDELIRKDFCNQCWEQLQDKKHLTSWKTLRTNEIIKKKNIVDNDVLFNLFERFKESDSDRNRSYAYLLALILMRKRVLVFEDVRMVNGVEQMVMRFRIKRNEADIEVCVADPQLTSEQIEKLNQDLNKLIQVGDIELQEPTS